MGHFTAARRRRKVLLFNKHEFDKGICRLLRPPDDRGAASKIRPRLAFWRSDALLPIVVFIMAIIAVLAFMPSNGGSSDTALKPKIIKIKEKLWHHPADWQRNADKLKKT